MLCGVTLSQLKLGKNRNKTSGACHGDGSNLAVRDVGCDVTRCPAAICSGRDTAKESKVRRATVAKDAFTTVTSSLFDAQLLANRG